MAAMRRPGLAPRRFWIALRLTARERSGLTSGGALGGFQLLAQPFQLVFQPLLLFLQTLGLLLETLGLLPGLVALPPRTTQFHCEFANAPDRIEILEKQIIF